MIIILGSKNTVFIIFQQEKGATVFAFDTIVVREKIRGKPTTPKQAKKKVTQWVEHGLS